MLYCRFALLSFQDVPHMYYFSLRQHFVAIILNLPWKVLFLPPVLHYFLYRVGLFISPLLCLSLPLTMFKLQDAVLCHETMQEIYWPWVPPFDTQDVANRSCAISHLLRLPCKADLSCLQAIFKLWAQETYGARGNFIITALHLSDLIQARCRSCQSMLYIYTLLRQTRSNPTINTLAGVTAAEHSFELRWGAATRL